MIKLLKFTHNKKTPAWIQTRQSLLVTAAPDLLAAAQKVLIEFSNGHHWACIGTDNCPDLGISCQECVLLKLKEILKPAIKKAEGTNDTAK